MANIEKTVFDNKFPENWDWVGNNTIEGYDSDGGKYQPPDELKEQGFKPGYKPPAEFFNWFWRRVIKCVREIQSKFSAHREAEVLDHPDGSVTLPKLGKDVTDKFNYAFDVVYPIDIEQRGSGNNILYITVPGIESYDDMDGKAVALNTGIYCVQWDTPQTVYININGLGSKALYRPLPSNTHTDYDTRAYYTDKYVKGEISRYQTLIVSFRKDGSNVTATLLNPAPAARATKAVSENPDDEFSYVTPKGVYEAIGLAQMNVTYDEENKQLTFAYGAGFTGGGSGGGAGYVLPVASANRLGGIKVGTGINMDDDGTANVLAEIDPELVMTAEEMRRLVNEALEEV